MKHAILFGAALGLIALAFGEGAAVRVAQAIIVGVVALVALAIADRMTYGAISDALVPRGRYCYSDCP